MTPLLILAVLFLYLWLGIRRDLNPWRIRAWVVVGVCAAVAALIRYTARRSSLDHALNILVLAAFSIAFAVFAYFMSRRWRPPQKRRYRGFDVILSRERRRDC